MTHNRDKDEVTFGRIEEGGEIDFGKIIRFQDLLLVTTYIHSGAGVETMPDERGIMRTKTGIWSGVKCKVVGDPATIAWQPPPNSTSG